MHISDGVLALGVFIIAALFVGLVYLGREFYRLTEQQADGSRVKSLIEQETVSREIEEAAGRLWQRLMEDSESLKQIAVRLSALCRHNDDDP